MAKAKPVAKRFQEIYNEETMKDSPTCSEEALRIILASIAQKKWKLNAIYIKTAFLQGEEIDRKVFVMQPKEAETNKYCLLKKSVYGLGEDLCKRYHSVKFFLWSIGLKISTGDPSIFY